MDCERAFPKAFVVGFDAPASDPVPVLPSPSTRSGSSTARSLLTMLLKESQGSSASCTTLLQDAVDADCCDTQSEASCCDDADLSVGDEEDLAADDDFVVTATEPIPIVTAEPMQRLAEYWVSQRPLANRRLQAEAPRK